MSKVWLFKFLKTPYPFYENSRQGVYISLGAGFFIGMFCYLFKPFDLGKFTTLQQLGFGAVVTFVGLFFSVLLPSLFKKQLRNEGWKIYKEIIWVFFIFLFISVANYFYAVYLLYNRLLISWPDLIQATINTVSIGIIPTVPILLYKKIVVFKKVIKQVEAIDARILESSKYSSFYKRVDSLRISSYNNKDFIEFYRSEFLYLISSSNYVEVYYEKDGELNKRLIRNNISKVEKQIGEGKNIIRCHRSYMVNLDRIIKITGNLQGYFLQFPNISDKIPVSRSYTKYVKNYFLEKDK